MLVVLGMGGFTTGLLVAHKILENGKLQEFKRLRYQSFDGGMGRDFEMGKLTLGDLREHAAASDEPTQHSGKQEMLENFVNDCLCQVD